MNALIAMYANPFAPTAQFIKAKKFLRFIHIYVPNAWGILNNRNA